MTARDTMMILEDFMFVFLLTESHSEEEEMNRT